MAGAHAAAVVAVEVLVEEQQLAPLRIALESLGVSVDRTAAVRVAQEGAYEPARQFGRDFAEVHPLPRPGRAFHGKAVAQVVMEALERFDEKKVGGEPHRTAP